MIVFNTQEENNVFVDRVYRFLNYTKGIQNEGIKNYIKIVPDFINGKLSQCIIRLNDVSPIAAFISKSNGIEYITTSIGSTRNKNVLCDCLLKSHDLKDDKTNDIQCGNIYESYLEELQFVIQTLYEQSNDEMALKIIVEKVIKNAVII